MLLAFVSDVHFGKEFDPVAYGFMLDVVKDVSPDVIFLGGDIYDHIAVSSYPKSLEEEGTLQEEIDQGFKQLSKIRPLAASVQFLPGNHENRLVNTLARRARGLTTLQALAPENLYRLRELDIQCHPAGQPVKMGHLYLAHGHEFPTGGPSAARAAIALGVNILFGHVHQFTSAYRQILDGTTVGAWSNGCLSTLTPGYRLAPTWSQGFSLVHFSPSGFFNVTPVVFWRDSRNIYTIVYGKQYQKRLPHGKKSTGKE